MAEDSKSSAPWWLALAVPVVGAFATYWITSCSDERKNLTEENRAKEVIAQQHRDAYVARLREHKKVTADLSSSQVGRYFLVYFDNHCSHTVYIAARFLDLDNVTTVTGWYSFAPHERGRAFDTKGTDFSYYAVDAQHQLEWTGSTPQVIAQSDTFEYVDDEDFRDGTYILPGASVVKFIPVTINLESYGRFTETITCDDK